MERECFDVDAWPLWDLIAVLSLPGIFRLKAVVADQMAGFIAGEVRQKENLSWIVTLGVRPAFRRNGIAVALLAACEEQLPTRRIRLSVRRSNLPALDLYLKHGYREVGVWRKYYAGGEDALVLEKER